MDEPFETDGCSVVEDYDQQECCVRHDWLYWQGGSIRDRWRADRAFYQCVTGSRFGWLLAPIRWFGVRVGGIGFLPFPDWRWGYGWKYPRSKAPKNDNSPYTAETQSEIETLNARLKAARAHDEKMREKYRQGIPS